jgi:hypothetical protein
MAYQAAYGRDGNVKIWNLEYKKVVGIVVGGKTDDK